MATHTLTRPAVGGYGELTAAIKTHGLLDRRRWSYARHSVLVLGTLIACVVVMAIWRDAWWLLALAPVMAIVSTQIGFLGHDVGHLQVTRNVARSRSLGLIVGNLFGGLSYGWWVRKHNAHHAHPNDLERDPDVRVGVLVFDADQAGHRRGLGAWTTKHQAALFFPLLMGEALSLHLSSVLSLWSPDLKRRYAEGAMLFTHFVAYFALVALTLTWPQALAFVIIHKALQGVYLGSAFASNHKGMPVLDDEQAKDPMLRQVLTSRNVRGGWFADIALGALNYQIEHHLFPSMPRANLRRAQPIVRQFCADRHIPYLEVSAFASYRAALGHLRQVGGELRTASSL